MVVASQTISTTAVVLPAWRHFYDVVHRTELLAEPTLDAGVLVHPEFLVRNQVLVVVTANNVGVGIGNSSANQFYHALLPVLHHLADVLDGATCFLYLLPFPLLGVQV